MAFVEWTGTSGPWSLAPGWSTGTVPTSADDVAIGLAEEVEVDSGAFARTIELSDNAVLASSTSITVGTLIRIGAGGSGTSKLWVNGGTLSAPNIEVGPISSGLLVVGGGSTSTGSINVNNGSVIVGGTSPASAGTINGPIALNNAGSNLTFRTTNDATYGGNISGQGSILIDSANRFVTLTGNNSGHSGTTTVQAGILAIGNGGTLGTGDVILMGAGALELVRSDTQLIANNISGAGGVNVYGNHTAVLTGTNSYGATFISSVSTLQIGNGGTTGTLGSGAVLNTGTLAFQHSSGQYNHVNAISGSGNLVVRGTALEVLVGNNSYSGTTSIEGGTLAVGLFGTTGTLGTGAVTIASGAFLDLIRSDTQLVANTISGAGELRVYGDHTVILTADNSYGNTTVFAGSTLQIGNGGITGTLGTGAVINDGTLVFSHGVQTLVHGYSIGGSGGLTYNGQGIGYLSGVSSYTGTTTINSGRLALLGEGSISNSAGIVLNGSGRFDISNISGTSASVRDVFLTGAGTQITMTGNTLIVTHADLYAGPGRFSGSLFNEAVVFNVASADYTLAGATTGAVFSNWIDGQDSITINGNAGANTLTGDELQATTINGGAGNDRIVIGNGGGNFDGGADSDTLVVGSTMTLTGTLAGLEALELSGGAILSLSSAQFVGGFAVNSALSGTGTIAIAMAVGGPAVLARAMAVQPGAAIVLNITGSSGTDIIKGSLGAPNVINGNAGLNQLVGGNQVDTIDGGANIDKIRGDGGGDILTGGMGNDVFKYRAVTDSTVAAPDSITDFISGADRLNFGRIDTDPGTAGDQAFTYVGTAAFAGGGVASIRWVDLGANLRVEADVNGDGTADMHILLLGAGVQVLTIADFVL